MRVGFAIAVGLVGCGHAARHAPLENRSAAPAVTAPLATALDGPYETVDAYCDHVRASAASVDEFVMCGQQASDAGEAGPFDAIAMMEVAQPDDHASIGCAVLVEIDTRWYATPVSRDVCAESGYIEFGDVRFTPLDYAPGLAIDIGVHWHTNDYSDSADYTLTTLCGLVTDTPRCTPIFVSACERQAPAGSCADHGYRVTWSIAAGEVTFDAEPAPSIGDAELRELVGSHPLGF